MPPAHKVYTATWFFLFWRLHILKILVSKLYGKMKSWAQAAVFWWNILVINIKNAEATLSKFEKQLTSSTQQIWENSEENIQPATLVKVNSTTRGVLGIFQISELPFLRKPRSTASRISSRYTYEDLSLGKFSKFKSRNPSVSWTLDELFLNTFCNNVEVVDSKVLKIRNKGIFRTLSNIQDGTFCEHN